MKEISGLTKGELEICIAWTKASIQSLFNESGFVNGGGKTFSKGYRLKLLQAHLQKLEDQLLVFAGRIQ